MNVLVVVNSTNQDLELGAALEGVLVTKKWKVVDAVPFSYSKKYNATLSEAEILKLAKDDLKAAIVESEWPNVTYLICLSDKPTKKVTIKLT